MEAILGVVIGLVVGGGAVWFLLGLRAKTSEKLLETAREELRDTFKAAASDVVANNSQQFLQLANENFGRSMEAAKGQLDQHRQQFEAEVTRLSKFYEKLNPNIESLITRANELTSETGKLSNALTNNRQIGSWGEIQLRRVVELAGMMDHCDFSEQTTVEGSSERPDLTVHLPEQRAVVVDAKASTAAFMEAQQAEDEGAADRAMLKHASALRTQVDDLAGKRYGEKVEGRWTL